MSELSLHKSLRCMAKLFIINIDIVQVTLNNIPEYIKVWERKPLLPRDYGLKHFDRKPWQ